MRHTGGARGATGPLPPEVDTSTSPPRLTQRSVSLQR